MAILLPELENIVRLNARNALDSSMYSNTTIDYAIQRAQDELYQLAKPVRTLTQLTLTSGSNVLPMLPADWLPEFNLDAYVTTGNPATIVNPNLILTSYQAVLRAQYNYGTVISPGVPKLLGFSTQTGGIVGPLLPDSAYVVNLWWWKQPPVWVAGSGTGTFDLSDRFLRLIGMYGAPAALQEFEPENAERSAKMWAVFVAEAKRARSQNTGGLGETESVKDELHKSGVRHFDNPQNYYPQA